MEDIKKNDQMDLEQKENSIVNNAVSGNTMELDDDDIDPVTGGMTNLPELIKTAAKILIK